MERYKTVTSGQSRCNAKLLRKAASDPGKGGGDVEFCSGARRVADCGDLGSGSAKIAREGAFRLNSPAHRA